MCHRKKNESMHASETLFLLVIHHIRVSSECQTVWLQFTVQVRSLLGLIWVQTVATTQTDKDFNVSFCRRSIYFHKIIKCTCAYHVYAVNRFFFDIFMICDAESKGSGETVYTHMLQVCTIPKRLLLNNLPENLSHVPRVTGP